jgi:uncharacterized membrane protein YwzB
MDTALSFCFIIILSFIYIALYNLSLDRFLKKQDRTKTKLLPSTIVLVKAYRFIFVESRSRLVITLVSYSGDL